MPEPELAIEDSLETAFARGDEGALEAVYREHGSLVYTVCRKSLPEDRAAEVTQDVFVSAWRARTGFDPARGNLAAWLVGITKHRIIDHVRAERRHADRRSDAPTAELADENEVERTADRLVVAQLLRDLPDRQRSMIELAYMTGLTHTEIADKTGVPLGTVKSDIRRGIARLRDLMGSAL